MSIHDFRDPDREQAPLRDRVERALPPMLRRASWQSRARIQAIATDLADYLPDDKVVEVIEDLYAVVAGEFGE